MPRGRKKKEEVTETVNEGVEITVTPTKDKEIKETGNGGEVVCEGKIFATAKLAQEFLNDRK